MKIARRFVPAALVAVLLIPLVSTAQNTADARRDVIARMREEGLQRSQVMDIAGYIVDVLGSRLTNSEAMKRGQVWAKSEMEKLGLENVTLEPFMDYGVTWDNEYFSLHMLEPDYTPMTGYPLTHTPGTKGRVVCPVVIADAVTRADLAKLKGRLKGAAVLAGPPLPVTPQTVSPWSDRMTDEDLTKMEQNVLQRPPRPTPPPANPDILKPEERIAFFRSEGAVAVFQCDGGRPGVVIGFSRPGAKDDKWSRGKTIDSLPIAAVTPEHYNRMYRIVKRGIPVKVEIEVRNRIGEKSEQASNLLGEIPGSDLKDEVVMIGAHFDSWHGSPNASDDASGCAVVLEAARILKAVGVKPRRTIRVALWGGEEQGLFGSTEYVRKHFGSPKDPKNPPTAEYDKLQAYFNQDYGAGQYRGIYLQGNERVRDIFKAWMGPFADFRMTAAAVQSVGSTDHVPFDEAGLPGFQFIQDRLIGPGGHNNLDYLDTLSAEDLMKNAVVMAAFAYQAAMCDEKLPRKTVK